MRKLTLKAAALAALLVPAGGAVQAQEYYIGQIIMGGWNFCPRGTASADGQLLAISSNTALFSLYGTQYGGDGRTTFALPDLRGRSPVHTGNGPGLAPRTQGQKGGAEAVTLNANQMPAHTHATTAHGVASTEPAATGDPTGGFVAGTGRVANYVAAGSAGTTVNMADGSVAVSVGPAGGNQPVSVLDPFQVIRFCVVTQGLFPSRS